MHPPSLEWIFTLSLRLIALLLQEIQKWFNSIYLNAIHTARIQLSTNGQCLIGNISEGKGEIKRIHSCFLWYAFSFTYPVRLAIRAIWVICFRSCTSSFYATADFSNIQTIRNGQKSMVIMAVGQIWSFLERAEQTIYMHTFNTNRWILPTKTLMYIQSIPSQNPEGNIGGEVYKV